MLLLFCFISSKVCSKIQTNAPQRLPSPRIPLFLFFFFGRIHHVHSHPGSSCDQSCFHSKGLGISDNHVRLSWLLQPLPASFISLYSFLFFFPALPSFPSFPSPSLFTIHPPHLHSNFLSFFTLPTNDFLALTTLTSINTSYRCCWF